MPKTFASPVARAIPLNNTGIAYQSTDLQNALAELRNRIVYTPQTTATTLNGTLQLVESSTSFQIITGTATGYTVKLPNATTLFLGRKFQIANRSSQAIVVRDFDNNLFTTLNSGDLFEATLQADGSSAGVWVNTVVSSLAAGVNAFNVTGSTPFVTSSSTDTILTGLTLTPPAGTYGVWFSADIVIGSNNREAECVIYKAGSEIADTRRSVQGVSSNFSASAQTLGITQVNGSEALDVRVNISSGTLTVNGRSFLIIRLGA